jgi:hypothetical protein
MKRPTTHRWLPVYFWILLGGIGATILPIYRALNLPGSGGYIFLGVLLIAIRAAACWGLFTRKLWGWYLNFIALFLIPIVKVLIPLMYSYNAYDVKQLGGSAIAVSFFWLIYAIPNTIYFTKRKYLFDDGKGPYKTLFGGSGFRVLGPQSVSGFTASNAPSLGRTVEVPSIAVERDPVVKKVLAEVPVEIEECVLFDKEMEEEMAAINLSDKSDEQFYEIAQREVDTGDIAKGLMLKAEVATGGDAGKARLLYIKTRAQELATEERSLASLRDALAGAVKNEKSADTFSKWIERFRADYPKNSKIDELQAEFEYQRLTKATRPKGGDTTAVSWEVVNERWVRNTYANGDVTMSDKDAGRMWLCNVNSCGQKTWAEAVAYCDNLTYAGYSDWQLPDKDTLEEQFSQKSFFTNVQDSCYWSETPYAHGIGSAWSVDMTDGCVDYGRKAPNSFCVWPVRGG